MGYECARFVRFRPGNVAIWLTILLQDLSAFQEKVKQVSVQRLMVIVDKVTSRNGEGGDEVTVKAAKVIERDIKDLLRYAQTF